MSLKDKRIPRHPNNLHLNLSSRHSKGLYIEAILLLLIFAILLVVTMPALEHFNKRNQYREIQNIAITIKGTIEKCLGLTRSSDSCDTDTELSPYGGISVHTKSSSLLDTVEVELADDQYKVILTPTEASSIVPFLDASLTLILTAEIHDRKGRPVIKDWVTDPQSGCMLVGLC